MSRRRLSVVAASLVALAVLVGVIRVARSGDGAGCAQPFDRRAWHAARAQNDPSGQGPRLRRLALRLVRCDELLGRTRRELRALLGRPTDTSTDLNPRPHREAAWQVGTNDDPSANDDNLFVEFDRGRAVYAETSEDVKDGGGDSATSGRPVGGGPVVD